VFRFGSSFKHLLVSSSKMARHMSSVHHNWSLLNSDRVFTSKHASRIYYGRSSHIRGGSHRVRHSKTGEQKTRKEKTRRQFDDEFKKDAARPLESGNSSIGQVAKGLGIKQATLSNWSDKARKERRDLGATPDLAAEIRRLCKENEQLARGWIEDIGLLPWERKNYSCFPCCLGHSIN